MCQTWHNAHYGLPIVTIVHIEPNVAHAHLHVSQVWHNVHYGLSIVTIVHTEPNMAHSVVHIVPNLVIVHIVP